MRLHASCAHQMRPPPGGLHDWQTGVRRYLDADQVPATLGSEPPPGEVRWTFANYYAVRYDTFTLILCVWALGILALGRFAHWSQATRDVLAYADDIVCVLFLIDFGVNLIRAERRWHYFITWGWIDLLSSIPSIDLLRWDGRRGFCASCGSFAG